MDREQPFTGPDVLYFAILIGYGKYQNRNAYQDLDASENDIEHMHQYLKTTSFQDDITVMLDSDREEVEQKMKEAVVKANIDRRVVAFVYYTGHGIMQGRDTVCIPGTDGPVINVDKFCREISKFPNCLLMGLLDCSRVKSTHEEYKDEEEPYRCYPSG